MPMSTLRGTEHSRGREHQHERKTLEEEALMGKEVKVKVMKEVIIIARGAIVLV